MIGFLFGWLGAMGFWIIYLIMTLFMGTLVIRYTAKETYRFITKDNEDFDGFDYFGFVLLAGLNYLFWPLILMGLIFIFVIKIALTKIFGPIMKRTIQFADSVMPKIEIKKE